MSAWVEENANRCWVARAIREQQEQVSMGDLALIQDALYAWRKTLAPRLPEGELPFLVVRHGAVLLGALQGVEVP